MNRLVLLSILVLSTAAHRSASAIGFDKGQAKADQAALRTQKKIVRGDLRTAYSLRLSNPRVATDLAEEVVSRNRFLRPDDPVAPPRLVKEAQRIIAIARNEKRLARLEEDLKDPPPPRDEIYRNCTFTVRRILEDPQMDRAQQARFKMAATDTVIRYNDVLMSKAKGWLVMARGMDRDYAARQAKDFRSALDEGAGFKLPFEPQMMASAKDKVLTLRAQRDELKQLYTKLTAKAAELNLLDR
jgi:hypothetical protein